jgi:fermentation-respiration switch protein FrsA (DUF1100 family)
MALKGGEKLTSPGGGAARAARGGGRKVGAICLAGGRLAFLAAATQGSMRPWPTTAEASTTSWMKAVDSRPVQFHHAELDDHIPASAVEKVVAMAGKAAEVHVYRPCTGSTAGQRLYHAPAPRWRTVAA